MKNKILQALKTKFNNLGFGDKAFDGVASFLEQTVKEESEIETAVSGVEPLLKAFQGDIDKRVSTMKSELDELKKKKPADPEPPKKPEPKQDDFQKQISEAIKHAVEPLQQKIEGYEKRETQKQLQSRVLDSVKEEFKTDREKKAFDAWMRGRSVEIDDENKLNETIESLKTGYNEFRQEMVDQGVIAEIPPDSGAEGGAENIDDFLNEKFGNNEN